MIVILSVRFDILSSKMAASHIVCYLGEFQLRVPVVVLQELEGLGKSRDNSDRPEHAAMLRENSKVALAWIKEKPQNVKCVTTKGMVSRSNIGVYYRFPS